LFLDCAADVGLFTIDPAVVVVFCETEDNGSTG
jgi:hypothetical protein